LVLGHCYGKLLMRIDDFNDDLPAKDSKDVDFPYC
jgi:hypothetical protein